MCFDLCIHLLQTKDFTAHLNSSAFGIASVGREGRARRRGKYGRNTFTQLPENLPSDTEIWMCSFPPGLIEVVPTGNVLLLTSKSYFQMKAFWSNMKTRK